MQHRIILPGATTLTRLISEVREKATLRLWNKLALIPSAEQRSQLEMLLGPTDCSRLSLLESLKKGPVTISGPAFNEAIERWKTLNDFGLHAENLSTLPAVRLKNLARYAGMTSVFNIARMSPQKRMAVLVAFVLAWETLALDDALDVLDAMLAVIIRDARKIGQKKRLRSLKDLDKSALALASACSYLLKEETPDESISFTLPQALRAQGLLKEAEHVESQSAETVLTPDECQLLGYLDKGKRKRKEKAGSLQWAYMAIARLGGFMDSKRTGIASWGALW